MHSKLNLISQGIVPRLRITFCVIAIILVTQLTVGFALVRSLNTSVDDLTQSALSVFLITEDSERELKNLLLLLQRVKTAESVQDLVPLEDQLTVSLTALKGTVDRMAGADILDASSSQMATALTDIENSARTITTAKGAALAHATKVQNFEQELLSLRQDTRLLLERLSFDASKRTDEAISQTTAESEAGTARLTDWIGDSLALANTLTTITLQLESIMVKAQGFKNLTNLDDLQAREQNLRFDIRSVVILTSQLPPSEARTELARALASLRDLLFASDGLAPEIFAKTAQQTTLVALLAAQDAPMTTISTLSQQLNSHANAQVVSARLDLSRTTRNLTLIAAFTTLASFVAIGCANVFVVERQINRRVARLTKAVLSIADGQTAYDVNVQGQDELGKIAQALETFKINAEELNRSNAELEKGSVLKLYA